MERRRLVTGHDASGLSTIVSEGPSPGRRANGRWEELWAFDSLPAKLDSEGDPADRQTFRLAPLRGTIACRLFTIPARAAVRDLDEEGDWETRMDYTETEIPAPSNEPWMHRTPTVDNIVIVTGEMSLVLDGGEEVLLRPGDSVVQRGTMHAWRNDGAESCIAVAFMVRAE